MPAVEYHWDFCDGTGAIGPRVAHAYTRAANFTIRLTVDGVPVAQVLSVKVTGNLRPFPNLFDNRRFAVPTNR